MMKDLKTLLPVEGLAENRKAAVLSSCIDAARGLRTGRSRDALSCASCTHVGWLL